MFVQSGIQQSINSRRIIRCLPNLDHSARCTPNDCTRLLHLVRISICERVKHHVHAQASGGPRDRYTRAVLQGVCLALRHGSVGFREQNQRVQFWGCFCSPIWRSTAPAPPATPTTIETRHHALSRMTKLGFRGWPVAKSSRVRGVWSVWIANPTNTQQK